MSSSRVLQAQFNRRRMVKGAALAGAGVIAGRLPFARGASAATNLTVLSSLAPDPAPPGVAAFSNDAFAAWLAENDAAVTYEAVAWPQLHDKMAANFASGNNIHDLIFMSGWVPEFGAFLRPIDDMMPPNLKADLPESSFTTVTWDGKIYGLVFTLSLLTLYYNTEHLQNAGITIPPATWDDLKGYAKELTGSGQYGWVLNYGTPEGIGGTASYWMTFLQQAGGTMYGADGLPVFNAAPGVDALQFMIDLLPYTDPSSFSNTSIIDATNVLKSGTASMMMNWPFMWSEAQNPETSLISGKLGSSILPAGPAGSASIDGADAWTITSQSPNPELSMKLIEFYLSKEVQKRQAIDTGWLPIRLSVLRDPDVQAVASNAAVVLEQSTHPYDSFVTPDYDAITHTLGTEILKALQGEKTAAEALSDASEAVTEIVRKRSGA